MALPEGAVPQNTPAPGSGKACIIEVSLGSRVKAGALNSVIKKEGKPDEEKLFTLTLKGEIPKLASLPSAEKIQAAGGIAPASPVKKI
jgi:hypothetical protein